MEAKGDINERWWQKNRDRGIKGHKEVEKERRKDKRRYSTRKGGREGKWSTGKETKK